MKSSLTWKFNRKDQSFSASGFGHTAKLVGEGSDGFQILTDGIPVYMEPTLQKAKKWAEANLPYLSAYKLILCDDWSGITREVNRQLKIHGLAIRIEKNTGDDRLGFLVERTDGKNDLVPQ